MKLVTPTICAFAFLFTAGAQAADPAAGQAKSGTCIACHGADGNSVNPLWPKLAGQHVAYLEKQMKDFRDGKRQDPVMAPMTAALSDEDIADIAAFYAGQTQK